MNTELKVNNKMKYTNYLINGKVIDTNILHTDNLLLKPISTLGTVVIVAVSFLGITTILPIAILIDGYRSTKYKMIICNKKYFHIKRINSKQLDKLTKFLDQDIPSIESFDDFFKNLKN